jgi:hypothetical protein
MAPWNVISNFLSQAAPTITGPNPQSDEHPDVQALLAPYRDQAAKLYPMNPIFGDQNEFATHHPKVAGILGNLLLAGSQAGTGRTVGESIGIASRMALAPGQYRQQQQLHRIDYEQSQVAADMQRQHIQAQIGQERASATHMGVEDAYDKARMAHLADPVWHGEGGVKVDDEGHEWMAAMDAKTHQMVNTPLQPVPEGYQPSFNKIHKQAAAADGGLVGHIIGLQMSEDPEERAQGHQMGKLYTGIMGQVAGSRTGGEQTAPHPFTDKQTFITNQRQELMNSNPPPEKDFQKFYMNELMTGGESDPQKAKSAWQKQHDTFNKTVSNFLSYTQSPDVEKGTRFDSTKDYSKPAPAKAKAAGPTSGGKKSWNPQKGIYE